VSVNDEQNCAENEALLDDLRNPGMEKRGENALTGFVRTKIREVSARDCLIEPSPGSINRSPD
jgi:hypothetical protein